MQIIILFKEQIIECTVEQAPCPSLQGYLGELILGLTLYLYMLFTHTFLPNLEACCWHTYWDKLLF